MDRGIERAQRHRRPAGTATANADPDQWRRCRRRRPGQQHPDRDFGRLGGGPHQGRIHKRGRLGGAREEIEPGRPYLRKSHRIGDLDGHALRHAPWNVLGLDVVLQCHGCRPAMLQLRASG
jgi:hypothetical protein